MNKKIYIYLFLIAPAFAWASGDSINYSNVNHWETAVYSYDLWQYHFGDSEPPADWNTLNFDDGNWEEGRGGIGYGDGDDATVISPVQSLYMRHQFTVTDISKIEGAFFHADFDDGFVAYLNGVEIARANLSGTPPDFDEWAQVAREARLFAGGLPERYILGFCEIEALLTDGENVLAVQVHNYEGAASSDMSSIFFLSFGINDDSRDYGSTPPWFFAPKNFTSHLPIVKVFSNGGNEILDEPKIPGRMEIVWNGDGQINSSEEPGNEFNGKIGVELRGQSSLFFFPKKNLGIETVDENGDDLDVSFLGFPSEEDWILHGPYSDKTLMRNVLSMDLARKMGQYASRTRYVELMVNGEYQGVYLLMEKIKRDEGRLDLANLKEEDIVGEELTGGYVFKIDKGDIQDWESQYSPVNNSNAKIQFQFVSPNRNKIQPEQAAYLKSYVDSMELALNNRQFAEQVKHYREFMDYRSFAEHILLAEFSKNVDAYRISTYFHKKKITNGGKVYAGPVWDFNLSFGNSEYCSVTDPTGWMYYEHCGNSNPIWFHKLLVDPEFKEVIKCRWEELRQGPFHRDSIFQFIDKQVAVIGDAVDRNFEKWPTLDEYVWPNAVVTGSYAGEIDFLKNNISSRLDWMDENVWGECFPVSVEAEYGPFEITVYPNPTSYFLNISLNEGHYEDEILSVEIYDFTGNKIAKFRDDFENLNVSGFPKGIYFLNLEMDNGILLNRKILIN